MFRNFGPIRFDMSLTIMVCLTEAFRGMDPGLFDVSFKRYLKLTITSSTLMIVQVDSSKGSFLSPWRYVGVRHVWMWLHISKFIPEKSWPERLTNSKPLATVHAHKQWDTKRYKSRESASYTQCGRRSL